MADETVITQVVPATEEPSRAEERIQQLSEKVKNEATAREAAEKAKTEAEKRATFAEGFSDILATNPAAKDFKADIQAKVMSGYSVEDATFAVLGKAGKIGIQVPNVVPTATDVAGGSAVVNSAPVSQKSPLEMTQDERREALSKSLIWQ